MGTKLRVAALVVLALIAPFVGTVGARAANQLEGIPTFDHVFVLVLENESFANSWGSDFYLQALRSQGVLVPSYYAVSHVSADNYMAMTSGQSPLPPFQGDCINYASCYAPEKALTVAGQGQSIADQLVGVHKTWKGYMESMGAPCVHPALTDATDPHQSGYATRHNPFVYYPSIVDDQSGDGLDCNQHVVDYSTFGSDLASGAPNLSFIVPNTVNDGHDSGLAPADCWMANNIWTSTVQINGCDTSHAHPLLSSPVFTNSRSLLIVTFDEAANTDMSGCCTTGEAGTGTTGGGRIGLVAIGSPGVPLTAGACTPATSTYDHASLLRTLEDGFGIGTYLNNAAHDRAMTDLFTTTNLTC